MDYENFTKARQGWTFAADLSNTQANKKIVFKCFIYAFNIKSVAKNVWLKSSTDLDPDRERNDCWQKDNGTWIVRFNKLLWCLCIATSWNYTTNDVTLYMRVTWMSNFLNTFSSPSFTWQLKFKTCSSVNKISGQHKMWNNKI